MFWANKTCGWVDCKLRSKRHPVSVAWRRHARRRWGQDGRTRGVTLANTLLHRSVIDDFYGPTRADSVDSATCAAHSHWALFSELRAVLTGEIVAIGSATVGRPVSVAEWGELARD